MVQELATLSVEQIKAKSIQQDKVQIIAPFIHKLNLRKEEVNALLSLDKKRLQSICKKLDALLNTKRHESIIVDPEKAASMLWFIGKSACAPGQKIIPNQKYTIQMYGVQVMGCFAMAKSLYALNEDNKPKEEECKKQ